MALYALDDLDDALAATRAYLTPVDRTTWAKLALVVLFIAGPGTNAGSAQYSVGGTDGGDVGSEVAVGDVTAEAWVVVAVVVAVVLVVALAFALVGSVMEFVFVESLRREAVTIRRYWGERWRQGLRLFGFRLLLGVFTLGTVLVVSAPLLLATTGIDAVGEGLGVAAFLLLLPFGVVLGVVVGVVNGFTTVFVVPVMVLEDCGVVAGWRRLWRSITAEWVQYLAYAVAGFVLSILGGFLAALATGLLALALLVPFGLLFAVGGGLFLAFEPLGVAVLVVVGVAFGLTVVAAAAVVQVPVQTYLRFYALFVLGDLDPDLDLVPEQRAAVREPSADSNAPA